MSFDVLIHKSPLTPLPPQPMNAVTCISATHTDALRHYGKLAGLAYSQDMENHLPRPAEPTPAGDAMDTSLDHNQPSDHPPSAATEAQHALPAKPPVGQEPLPAIGTTGNVEETAETIGQTGKTLAFQHAHA